MTKILNAVTLQPEPPTEVVRRIKQIDERLSLKYMPEPGAGWWIICDWVPNDPRRMMIQRGDMPPEGAYDLVSFLPPDCPLEEVPAYILKGMRGNARKDIHEMCERVDRFNRQQTDDAFKVATEPALDYLEVKGGTIYGDGSHTVKVPQYTGPDPTASSPTPPPAAPEAPATGAARRGNGK